MLLMAVFVPAALAGSGKERRSGHGPETGTTMMTVAAILSLVMGALALGFAVHSLFSRFVPLRWTIVFIFTCISLMGFSLAAIWYLEGDVRYPRMFSRVIAAVATVSMVIMFVVMALVYRQLRRAKTKE
jgi:hypothetical protein